MLKTFSTMNEPVNVAADAGPRKLMTGSTAFFSPCFQMTVARERPLARAVRMKSLLSMSIIETRVRRAMYAIGVSDSARPGSPIAGKEPHEPIGNQCSVPQNRANSAEPITKLGRLMPIHAAERLDQAKSPPHE